MSTLDVKKLLVWAVCPDGYSLDKFNEAVVTASGNNKDKVYFNASTNEIVVKGVSFGASADLKAKIEKAVEDITGHKLDEFVGTEQIGIAAGSAVDNAIQEAFAKVTSPNGTVLVSGDGYEFDVNIDGVTIVQDADKALSTNLTLVWSNEKDENGNFVKPELKLVAAAGTDDEKVISTVDGTDFVKDGFLVEAGLTGVMTEAKIAALPATEKALVEEGKRYLKFVWNTDGVATPMYVNFEDVFDVDDVAGDDKYISLDLQNKELKLNTVYGEIGLGSYTHHSDEVDGEVKEWDEYVAGTATPGIATAENVSEAMTDLKTDLEAYTDQAEADANDYSDKKNDELKAELIGAADDAVDADTINGAKNFASDADATLKADLIGTAEDKADADTIYGAKAYADEALKNLEIKGAVVEKSDWQAGEYIAVSTNADDNKQLDLSINTTSEIVLDPKDVDVEGKNGFTPDALTTAEAVYKFGVNVLAAANAYTDGAIEAAVDSLDSDVTLTAKSDDESAEVTVKVAIADGKLDEDNCSIDLSLDLWEEFKIG